MVTSSLTAPLIVPIIEPVFLQAVIPQKKINEQTQRKRGVNLRQYVFIFLFIGELGLTPRFISGVINFAV